MGRTLLARGCHGEAVSILAPALRGNLESGGLYVTQIETGALLAQAYERVGKRDSAVLQYRRVADAWRRGDAPFRARAREAQQKAEALSKAR